MQFYDYFLLWTKNAIVWAFGGMWVWGIIWKFVRLFCQVDLIINNDLIKATI